MNNLSSSSMYGTSKTDLDDAAELLIRLVIRAYYTDMHIVIVDCLLEERWQNGSKNQRVSTEHVSSSLDLSKEQVRDVLQNLRADGLVSGDQRKIKDDDDEKMIQKRKWTKGTLYNKMRFKQIIL